MDPRWRGDPRNAFGPEWEAGVARVTAHEEDRGNKLKALGNAIVPAVAYELMLMMLEVDDAYQAEAAQHVHAGQDEVTQ